MILSGPEIKKRLGKDIAIDPFVESRLNPNSYNLTLAPEIMVYTEMPLDMKKANPVEKFKIGSEGLLLEPGKLYLARTAEYTKTYNLVPMLEGRSSIGRLGLYIHVTAGFGDVGFEGYWTLEMHCVHPIRIYAGVEICQIFYHQVAGETISYESKKYQRNAGVQASRLWMDFHEEEKNSGNA
ncbi:MAG: dCTP deaminase [Proteobacteria bacterium]|nr:dCTP deaminase [Pseudomonadota bacterium]